jgi:hypothetical protein
MESYFVMHTFLFYQPFNWDGPSPAVTLSLGSTVQYLQDFQIFLYRWQHKAARAMKLAST